MNFSIKFQLSITRLQGIPLSLHTSFSLHYLRQFRKLDEQDDNRKEKREVKSGL